MKIDQIIVKQQVEDCLLLLKKILGEDLLGVYVYGSLLMGELQKFSDIDVFAISKRETTPDEKRQLEQALLHISGIYTVSKDLMPIELTIVAQSDVKPWNYPPKFDFLYGDWLRKDFESGNVEPWPTKTLPNLALVITQLLLSNQIVFGPQPSELLDPVPYRDFLHAMTKEIDSLMADIDWDTRNVLLTYARIWSTVETDEIRSKADAVSWAIERLPNEFKPLLRRAKSILLGQEEDRWDDLKQEIKPCADFMIQEIKKRIGVIETSKDTSRAISIA